MANLPTYGRNEATKAAREAEYDFQPDIDFDGGMNKGGSCAPGIGIATGVRNPTTEEWTTNTQYGVTREPQLTMHIGGDGTAEGSDNHLGDHAVMVADYVNADENDTANFVVADQAAAPGAVYHAATGAVNRTSENIEVGDRVWGTVPVA